MMAVALPLWSALIGGYKRARAVTTRFLSAMLSIVTGNASSFRGIDIPIARLLNDLRRTAHLEVSHTDNMTSPRQNSQSKEWVKPRPGENICQAF